MPEVTDPSLIALLEQPQTKINETLGAGIKPEDMTSIRTEALEKIALARSLKKRSREGYFTTGFLAPTMAGVGDWTGAGAVQTDTDTLKNAGALQRVMELAKANGGKNPLTPLSNSDFQALANSVANLAIGQPDHQYQRNVATIEDIYKRAYEGSGGKSLEDELKPYLEKYGAVEPGEKKAPSDGPTGPGDIGFNTPFQPSDPLTPDQQSLYDAFWKANPNATADQLRQFGASINVNIDNAEQIIHARDKGAGVREGASAVSGLTPEEQAEVDRRAAGTDATGAFVAGAGDTVTLGTLDKLASGAQALTDSLSGEGAFMDRYGRRMQVENAYLDQISDEHPWAYTSGQVAGSLVLPTFSARTPAQLAKVAAGYGGAYGVGSSDTLAEIPGNFVTGTALGAATGWGGGKLLEKLESRAAKKAAEVGVDGTEESAETAASRYARGQNFGLDLSIGDVRGMGAKAIERTLDVQPGSAGVMNKGREKLGEQISSAVEDVASTYGPSTSFEGMGRAAQSGVRKWQDKFESVAGKLYEAIPISLKTQARLDNTRQALSELTTIFESNPKMAEAFANTRLNRYMEALDPDNGGGLSWKDLKDFRSRIGEEIGDQRFSESPTKSELRRLYGALSEDMRATAQAQGPKALKAFERANAVYRQGQQRIDDAVKYLVGDDGAMTAEKAAARIQAIAKSGKASSDLAKLAEIRKSLPPEEAGELINGVIKMLGQPLNSEGRQFKPETFFRNFQDMAPEAKNLLFGGTNKELRQNLEEFAKVMGDVAGSNSTRNTSNTAMGLAGLIGFGAGGIPGLLGQAATSYGAARLWTNPKFVRWATGYSKMVKAAEKAGNLDANKVKTQANLLKKLAASDPALAQDVLPVQEAILKAVNDNLAKTAAAESEQEEK